MTTTSPTIGATLVQAATLLVAHLADHALPEPVSLTVTTRAGHAEVTAQLPSATVPTVTLGLLTWADTLSAVTATAWRTPERDRVHLAITSTLATSTGTLELHVFGGANHDPLPLADLNLEPDERRTVSLEQLRTWAANASTTTGTPVLDTHRAPR